MPAVAGEFFRQLRALFLHQAVERGDLGGQRIIGGFGLADDLGDEGADRHVERVARLVAAGQDAVGQPIARVVDPGDEIGGTQIHFGQQ